MVSGPKARFITSMSLGREDMDNLARLKKRLNQQSVTAVVKLALQRLMDAEFGQKR